MACMSVLLVLLYCRINPTGLQKQSPFDRIVHQLFIGRLFLFLDRQHGILPNLGCCVSDGICVLESDECFLAIILLQLLVFCSLDQPINSSLSQQITLHLLRSASLSS